MFLASRMFDNERTGGGGRCDGALAANRALHTARRTRLRAGQTQEYILLLVVCLTK